MKSGIYCIINNVNNNDVSMDEIDIFFKEQNSIY